MDITHDILDHLQFQEPTQIIPFQTGIPSATLVPPWQVPVGMYPLLGFGLGLFEIQHSRDVLLILPNINLSIIVYLLLLYPPDALRWILWITHEYTSAEVCRDLLVTPQEARIL